MDNFLETMFKSWQFQKGNNSNIWKGSNSNTKPPLSLEVKFAYILKEMDYFGFFYNAKLVYLSFKTI